MGRLKMHGMKIKHKKIAMGGVKCRTGKCDTKNAGLKNLRQVSKASNHYNTDVVSRHTCKVCTSVLPGRRET